MLRSFNLIKVIKVHKFHQYQFVPRRGKFNQKKRSSKI